MSTIDRQIMSASNSRFRTAVHALAVIAYVPEQQATSDKIAASVATDATVVRRLLSSLRAAGLVQAAEGRAGGYALARSPARISLKDVFEAVGADTLFPVPDRLPNPDCPVGANIHAVLDGPLADAQWALQKSLGKSSLADVMAALSKC
jgi:Rrf2 family protein